MRRWRMACPPNFPYNILKLNSNNEYVFYSPIICPITSTPLKPKKALSHLPALKVWDTGTWNKVVRFWVHRRADSTACKVKRNTYTFLTHASFHVTRVRYGAEFLPSNSGRTLVPHNLSRLGVSALWCNHILCVKSDALRFRELKRLEHRQGGILHQPFSLYAWCFLLDHRLVIHRSLYTPSQ